ncbi:MAG: TonB-dependent receptor [Prevotella sp.]|jgi:TonB-linked SusC/RagA family outer membrane protein|nr:TonB-dependent receptor [Prevotella sp.]
MRKFIYYLLFFCAFPVLGFAQTYQISGRVTDALDGSPLPGVTVQTQNKTATMTDVDGNYTIRANKGDVLSFTFIGMMPQSANVDSERRIDIAMSEDETKLDEVIVVGYGVMKKRDLSGAIVQIKGDELLKGNPATSINQALQGKLAGVAVTQNDGAPGAGISIQIRGINSFSTSSQPLYVVDGVPFDVASTPTSDANSNNNQTANPMALINPNNIESIEVLKDASATAIYGSRGANGVVLITTKRGVEGKDQIEVTTNFSVSQIGRRVKMLGAYDYANYINEQAVNDAYYLGNSYSTLPYPGTWSYNYDSAGNLLPHTGRYTGSPEDFLNPRTIYDSYGNSSLISDTDWQDQIYQTGFSQEYNVRVSGASSNGWHSFSGNYVKQEGIIVNSGYERYGLFANLGRKVHSWIELGTTINYTNSTTDFAKSNAYDYSVIRSALMFPPTYDPLMETSSMDELSWLAANPYMYVRTTKDQIVANNVFTSSYVELTFTDYLKFRQNLGINYSNNNRSTYYGRHTQEGKAPNNGVAGQADNWWRGITSESLVTFNKTFGTRHSLNALAGFTFENGNYGGKDITVMDFPSDVTGEYDLSAGLQPQTPKSSRGETSLVSLLGRANYVLDDKYIFTASFRRDGSSKFAAGNKFANFASGAFAWRASEEEFIKNLDIFSNLKLRASYGQTGNQGIGAYETLALLGTANYPYGSGLTSGYAEQVWRGPVNKDLKWETTDQYNAGIDFGFMNSRINIVVDYYYKKTKDLLQMVKIPQSTGFSNMRTNFGYVTNSGLELSGNFLIFDRKDFNWTIDANISFNKNKIGGLEADQFAQELWYSADQAFIQRNGNPIGAMFGYVEEGFYDSEAEVRARKEYANSSDAVVKAMVGEVKYRDLDGNGVIDDKDRTIIGNTNPDFTYGLTNNIRWKGFNFSFFLQGVQGNDMFNGNLMDVKMSNIGNVPVDAYNSRWTAGNTENALWPKATGGYSRVWRISDRYVEDGSYLRLKNVSLGYTVPITFKGIESLYVYGSASNLFTITDYSWFDPDVNAFGGDASRKGVDIYSYPSSRTYSFGLKVNF